MTYLQKQSPKLNNAEYIINSAKAILSEEANAILAMSNRLNNNFHLAIQKLINCKGKVVVTGIGKSGHIANKIAATLASTGTQAFFVHPAELRHGDFGMLAQNDLAIILSSSGETSEIKLVLEPLKRLGLEIIAFTGNNHSTLAQYANVVIDVGVEREACPHNLAPTSSTTATLAMGDALALVLMSVKGFSAEDFVRSHPGGSLGKQLLTVKDVMRYGQEIPLVDKDSTYAEVLQEINAKKLGFTTVGDKTHKLIGIITDGDLRRALTNHHEHFFELKANEFMTTSPKTINESALAQEALKIMETYTISDLLILDDLGRAKGIIDLKDLLKAGII